MIKLSEFNEIMQLRRDIRIELLNELEDEVLSMQYEPEFPKDIDSFELALSNVSIIIRNKKNIG